MANLTKQLTRFLCGDEDTPPKVKKGDAIASLLAVDKKRLVEELLRRGTGRLRKLSDSGRMADQRSLENRAELTLFSTALRVLPLSQWPCELWRKLCPHSALSIDLLQILHDKHLRAVLRKHDCSTFAQVIEKPSLLQKQDSHSTANRLISLFLRIVALVQDDKSISRAEYRSRLNETVSDLDPIGQQILTRALGLCGEAEDVAALSISLLVPTEVVTTAIDEFDAKLDAPWAWSLAMRIRDKLRGRHVIALDELNDVGIDVLLGSDATAAFLQRLLGEPMTPLSGVEARQYIGLVSKTQLAETLRLANQQRESLEKPATVSDFSEKLALNRGMEPAHIAEVISAVLPYVDAKAGLVFPTPSKHFVNWLLGFLGGSPAPRREAEIEQAIREERKRGRDFPELHRSALTALLQTHPEIVQLGRGAYGTTAHLSDAMPFAAAITSDAVDAILGGAESADRQWSAEEIIDRLPPTAPYRVHLTPYVLAHFLKKCEDVVPYGWLLYGLRGGQVQQDRIHVKKLLLDILTSHGGPMPEDELYRVACQRRAINQSTFRSAIRGDLYRDDDGCVGLFRRDLPGSDAQKKRALSAIEAWVAARYRDDGFEGLIGLLADAYFPGVPERRLRVLVRELVKRSERVRIVQAGDFDSLRSIAVATRPNQEATARESRDRGSRASDRLRV